MLDQRCGMPDRLGCAQHAIALDPKPEVIATLVQTSVRIFGNVSATAWQAMTSAPATRPVVAIGGMALLRQAKQHELNGAAPPVDVVFAGQLDIKTLHWWFEGVRALHFKTSNAIARIHKLTEGIALLVRHFNTCLQQADSAEISEVDFNAAEQLFNDCLPACAAQLSDPASDTGLTARELELLGMAVQVAREVAEEFGLDREFAEYWEMLGGDAPAPMSQTEDRVCLEMLTMTGLLERIPGRHDPAAPLGYVKVPPNGVIARLLAQRGGVRAD